MRFGAEMALCAAPIAIAAAGVGVAEAGVDARDAVPGSAAGQVGGQRMLFTHEAVCRSRSSHPLQKPCSQRAGRRVVVRDGLTTGMLARLLVRCAAGE